MVEVKGFLLSWYHAKDLRILPECFPDQIHRVSKQIESKLQSENPPACTEKHPSIKVRQEHARKLKEAFKSVFEVEKQLQPMQGKPMRILLTENATPFALTSPRTIPFAWKDQIKHQLDDMVEKNIIKEVTGPTDWCHPMLPVAKKNTNEVRLCVDLTRLNQFVRRGAHPVLTPHEAVSSIAKGSRYFSKFDARAGYWQVQIAEEDQELTTFITPWGRYKFLRAPMGLAISGDEYNRRGDEALQTIPNTVKIVDDILTYDEDYQQHLNHVWQVLNRCKENKITLNPNKFQFAEDEVNYCGYHLNKDGISPEKDKLSAITKFQAPVNVTELRSFLGLVNQLGQFSSDIASAAEPLRHLLKKNHEWLWTADHEKSFIKVKEALSKPPILAYYDPKLPVILQTDAAKLKGLGYACLQKHGQRWKLIDCGSRFLTATESRYATIELEMLAIVWAVKKCRMFLAGRQHFDIVTDHKPLLPIVNSKNLSDIENPRLQRLREKLTPYSFILTWKKGSEHSIPDALSRFPTEKATEDDEIAEQELEEQNHTAIISNIQAVFDDEQDQYKDMLLEETHKYSQEDTEYGKVKETIIMGFPEDNNELDPDIRPYARMKDLLAIDDDLIVCGHRLLIPRKLRSKVLKFLHGSHQGMERTKQRARQSVYWPNINNDIENTVKTCQECQKLLPSLQKEPMKSEEEPMRPFQSVSTDYFEHAGYQYLIYTDRLSGWPMVQMYRQKATANKLISTFRNFFSATGIPEVMRSDGGPQYKSKILNDFLQQWAVRHYKSSPYYPQSNGHAESSVKAVKHLIMKCTKNGNMDTDEFAMGLLELRNSPRVEGQSPAQILFGHPIRSNIPVHKRAYAEEWQQSKTVTAERREKARKYSEDKYNLTAKPLPELKVGNYINIQDPYTRRWTETGIIVEVGRNRQYLIKKQNGRLTWRNRRFIRKHHPLISPSSTNNYSPDEIPVRNRTSYSPDISSDISPTDPSPHIKPEPPTIPQPMPHLKNEPKNKFKNVKLPSTTKTPPQSPIAERRRQAPPRLQVNPHKKSYKDTKVKYRDT